MFTDEAWMAWHRKRRELEEWALRLSKQEFGSREGKPAERPDSVTVPFGDER